MFREAGLWGRRRVFSYPEICGKAIAVRTDVGNHEDVEALCARSLDQFSRIDAWINNAGIGALGRFDQEPVEDHIQVIRTNLHGAVYGSYYALRQFRRQSFGTLINVSSALGKMPAPYYGAYTASKHGMNGLDGVLRQELREDELETIRVCTVMPNSNDTPFFDHAANYTGREPQPIPPLYDPQEVIDTIFDLVIHPKDEVVVGGIGNLWPACIRLLLDFRSA